MFCARLLFAALVAGAAAQDADGLSREQLKPSTSFRQQHRRTVCDWDLHLGMAAVSWLGAAHDWQVDGRLCAAAFVQDKHVYTGCTDVPGLAGAAVLCRGFLAGT